MDKVHFFDVSKKVKLTVLTYSQMIILYVGISSFVNKEINYIRTASFLSCQVQESHLMEEKDKKKT